jgi:hypothetical protein
MCYDDFYGQCIYLSFAKAGSLNDQYKRTPAERNLWRGMFWEGEQHKAYWIFKPDPGFIFSIIQSWN